MKIIKKISLVSLCLFGIFVLAHVGIYIYCLLTPKIELNKAQSYYLYDNNKTAIINDNNKWIDIDNISDYLIKATIDTEDKHFYKHIGFDYLRIIKAAAINVVNGKLSEGASTITQQYARNFFLKNYDKTWSRKIKEAILAFELEVHYDKDDILEGYLNTINYGGVYGIENASYYYFGKSASDLNLAEASMLAGIPQSPSKLSPLVNLKSAKERQKVVLSLMESSGTITSSEKNMAINTNLNYVSNDDKDKLNNIMYFNDAVLKELETIAVIPESVLKTGGLKIYTTLDYNAQNSLENAVNKHVDLKDDREVAAIMIKPSDGSVMALIGGKNYSDSQFNRATDSKRQVGSTMKPFLYYDALNNGFTSTSSFTSEITTFKFSNNKTYSPKNYNDKYANSPITMGAAIAYSDNIYAVKTHLFLGQNHLVNIAKEIGITSSLEEIPSLALGTKEIKLIEMVNGYASFANLGYKVNSHFIDKIEDSKGNILYEYKEEKELILDPDITFILNEMLTYTYDSSFINYNYPTLISLLPKITNKYAIKSGTTDTDNWIIGFNKNAVLGVWSGYDNNKKIDSNSIHKDIWIDTMEDYFVNNKSNWYKKSDNVVGVLVNPISGELAKEEDKNSKIFYFIRGTEPRTDNEYNLDTAFKEEVNQ